MDIGNKGAFNEITAVAWLLRNGFHVFRNVSAHGPIDLIAVKNNETTFIDVKAGIVNRKGNKQPTYLSNKQVTLGVKSLTVYPDGTCVLAEPKLSHRAKIERYTCLRCGKPFETNRRDRKFCTPNCRVLHCYHNGRSKGHK